MRLPAAWNWTGRENERSWTGIAELILSSLSLSHGWLDLTDVRWKRRKLEDELL
jgi:hypothetical protein